MKDASNPLAKLLVTGCLAAALLLLGACGGAKKERAKTKAPVPVTVATAVQKDVPVQVKAIGNIEAYTSVVVKSQVNGQISRVHFQEGSEVPKGALLVTLDPEPFLATLSQSQAALARDQAQAAFAREQAGRYEALVKDGIVTRDQYEQLRTNADAFAATVVADRAAIRNAKIQLGYCYIRSPISGRTGAIALQPGNLVKSNDSALVTINQLSPIYATFSIPERRLPEVKRAMADGDLELVAAIPNETGSSEKGTLSFLDNSVNPSTGTIKLKGVFANRSRRLWPGQFTDVVLTLETRKNAVVVPTQAIQTGQRGVFVYVVKPDQRAELRQVTVGPATGTESVIDQGVATGETVVVDGQLRLTPGAAVAAKGAPPRDGKK